ncbi:MAG: hypothetical protein WC356_03220 [Candidatus Micrarchaeia archaeon]|jgi:hypothetical protein
MNKNTRKGQYFSFDIIIAVILFIITISLIFSYWFSIREIIKTNDSETYRTAIRISDVLVSKGNPEWDGLESWVNRLNINPDDIMVAGFAYDSNSPVLKEEIIWGLEDFVGNAEDGSLHVNSYNTLKSVLRTGYNVNIKVFLEGDYAGGVGTPTYDIGLNNYTNTNETVASYTRVIVLNNTYGNLVRGNLQVNLW